MTRRSVLIVLALLAAVVFLPPRAEERSLVIRCIDGAVDEPCASSFAYVTGPDRSRPTPGALWEDFAYAAADAGPVGCAILVSLVALVALLFGLWCGGFRCGLRRVLLTYALGLPVVLGLLYSSCFLEGREIRLGPDAAGWVKASLHTQTDRSTGLLSPAQLVGWHYRRGFRVLNVADRDSSRGGEEARRVAADAGLKPPLTVTVGEEWHGSPDLVCVNITHSWRPRDLSLEETVAGVQQAGGAVFLAHPWSKRKERTLEDLFRAGVDGVEIVNGVVHGGSAVVSSATAAERALLGVIDYKYGPHVNAVTLIPERLAGSPRGVVTAIRKRQTRVVYAIPGGATTGAAYEAELGTLELRSGLHTLTVTPHGRRAVWFAWLAAVVLLWAVTTRRPVPARGRPLGARTARTIFLVCVVIEFALPAALSWQIREAFGTLPMPFLLGTAALVAIPMLLATIALQRPKPAE
jgi:hypothetical protein